MSNLETTVRVEPAGHRTLVVTGEVDLAVADDLVAAVSDLGAEDNIVHIDLAGVTFMDSTGLAALIRVRNAAAAGGYEVILVAYSPAVVRVLELAGLTDLFLDGGNARG